ncbi:hypothetical protein LguiB_027317 [Lonicera macranthoides]
MASMPSIDDTLDGSSSASVTAPSLPRLPVGVEIGVMERVIGPSRGTRVLSLGSGIAKQPRRRGPSQLTELRNKAIKEELARLRANLKNLEANLKNMEENLQQLKCERKRNGT